MRNVFQFFILSTLQLGYFYILKYRRTYFHCKDVDTNGTLNENISLRSEGRNTGYAKINDVLNF
jgi:hypothetical protein